MNKQNDNKAELFVDDKNIALIEAKSPQQSVVITKLCEDL